MSMVVLIEGCVDATRTLNGDNTMTEKSKDISTANLHATKRQKKEHIEIRSDPFNTEYLNYMQIKEIKYYMVSGTRSL